MPAKAGIHLDEVSMGKYGKCAEIAVDLLSKKEASDPVEAWNKAVFKIFPTQKPSREKGCPKNAFLGLCEEGIVNGASSGRYTTSDKNKKYALSAVALLKEKPHLCEDENALWGMVKGNEEKKHNAQMDVVISLWNKKAIKDS